MATHRVSLALTSGPTRRPSCACCIAGGNDVEAPQLTVDRQPASAAADSKAGGKPAAPYRAVLLIKCPDAKGVVAATAQLLYGYGCSIFESDQFTDNHTEAPQFFQRISFDYSDMHAGVGNVHILEAAMEQLAGGYEMEWSIHHATHRKRVAILVSKMDHCLYDLLIRHNAGDLDCDIPIIVSNHADLAHVADKFNIEFRHLPIQKGAKEEQEAAVEEIIAELDIDLLVMARYMQILSPGFCERHWRSTINIHHSFLPAFEGGRPYHRAHARGVKLLGATAHYATSELDAGPIIEQGVTRITHRDSVKDMIRKGADLERLVLARAVRWHLEDRVIVHAVENKTVVFE